MCKAYSCIVTKSGKSYDQIGVDNHEEILKIHHEKASDKELDDDKESPHNTFIRVEINPKDGDYLKPRQPWILKIDERIKSSWWDNAYEKEAQRTFKIWKNEIYSSFDWKGIKNMVNPFTLEVPGITKKHLQLLYEWKNVKESIKGSVKESIEESIEGNIGKSIWESVKGRIWRSVWENVWESIWESIEKNIRESIERNVKERIWENVWETVWETVWGSIGTKFKKIKEWKYVNYTNPLFKKEKYPYSSVDKLWNMGLIPSFDGMKWRLHKGKDAKILWEGTVEELKKAVI